MVAGHDGYFPSPKCQAFRCHWRPKMGFSTHWGEVWCRGEAYPKRTSRWSGSDAHVGSGRNAGIAASVDDLAGDILGITVYPLVMTNIAIENGHL